MANSSGTSTAQRLTLITVIVLALLAIAAIVYFRLAPQQQPEQQAATASASSELDLSGQPMLGEASAPVAIAVFEDFKCPTCRYFDENIMPQVERELIDTGQARIYFLNFPFIGPDSTTAAIAGECVYHQNEAAFWDYKTYVFRSQGPESEQWATPAFLSELARNNLPAIDADALQSCIEDETYADEVAADYAMGNAAGIQGTPTVFVNGQRLESFDFAAIQAAVANAQGANAQEN